MNLCEDELIVIFSFLDPKEVLKISRTNKLYNKVSFTYDILKPEKRLNFLLNQNVKDRTSLDKAIISCYQTIFNKKAFGDLSVEQVKEILENLALKSYRIPKESKLRREVDYEWNYSSDSCTWTYKFEWFSNNCKLIVEEYQAVDNGFTTISETMKTSILKIEDWKISFESSQKDVKSLKSYFNDLINGQFVTSISKAFSK